MLYAAELRVMIGQNDQRRQNWGGGISSRRPSYWDRASRAALSLCQPRRPPLPGSSTMLILSAAATLIVAIALTLVGFWMVRRRSGHAAPQASPEDMSKGELALAWGICAAPLGLVFLIGDSRVGHDGVKLGAVILIAVGLGCVILRRVVYGRWN